MNKYRWARRLDDLMAEMTNRACFVGRRAGVMMPRSSHRRPDQKDDNRDRNDQVPDSFLVKHE
jgi:hypothetical protein